MKLLLVRLGSLGDLVHALPVASALRETFRDARVDWLVDARHAPFLDLVPVIDRRIVLGSRGGPLRTSAGPGVLATIRSLRRERYDAAIDLQGLIKSAVLARASGAARVIGFARRHLRERAASFFYTERCDPGGAAHVVDKNLALLRAFEIDDAPRRFPIAVPESAAASAVRDAGRLSGRIGYALLNPGAGWPNKCWPPDRFGGLAAWLARQHGLRPVVAWGPGEKALARRVVEASRGEAVAAPPTGIGDLLALARGARLVVSGDTGPLHLAAAVGAPVVALFGPTNPARNGPWDVADVSVSRYGECECRYRRRCRRRRACIEDISVDEVRAAVDRRLADVTSHA